MVTLSGNTKITELDTSITQYRSTLTLEDTSTQFIHVLKNIVATHRAATLESTREI